MLTWVDPNDRQRATGVAVCEANGIFASDYSRLYAVDRLQLDHDAAGWVTLRTKITFGPSGSVVGRR
jgi:hypothetical protein